MKAANPIKFASTQMDFFTTLNQRVNEYFKSNGIARQANGEMFIKTAAMFIIYFTPYFLILTETVTGTWPLIGLCVMMGFGVAGIGLSIMHDANHGSYSNKPWVNDLLGYSLNVVGGNAFNWKVQHNVLHHTYTNIHDVDEDISPRGILRMTPYGPWKFFHRFQHFYAWFFYGLMTLVWVVAKDFIRLGKYEKDGLVKKQKTTFVKEWLVMVSSKILYFVYILVIPMMVLSITWGQWLVGFLIMHYVAGFILAVIFQPAHVIDGTEYPLPDEDGKMENSWAIHQLHTTTNFANKNTILSWYCGGLNFQVEHHLFPNICHVHYRNISPIVEKTAKEFGLPYKSAPTFLNALWLHGKLLKELGKKPVLQVAQ
ncbi:fatty acid desaturase family protein [Pseudochryseolinea flava]|uniref:Acyl-CoA desaturase n=1 Tax=Pseudochryseolinea flava TaxID=2059302 RepID=A0A364YAP9_9BACT|nr:acyl-CoA desaturase [Pseudochryseolinea flava]RAW03445.1 acyl-CoA desaturase [Pseudochryseolinea flava]